MVGLKELVAKTDELFSAPIATLPKVTAETQDRIKVCEEAGLHAQACLLKYQLRCEQAQALGFIKIGMPEIVNLLSPDYGGSPYSVDLNYRGSWSLEYFYDNTTDSIRLNERVGWDDWHPGGCWTEREDLIIRSAPLDILKLPIPYGVVLRVQELKELKLFNYFLAHAPREMFNNSSRTLDPIVTGVITDRRHWDRTTNFFIAKW